MEYCQGGDLGTLIKKCKKHGTSLDEGFVWHILYQTGRAVLACHTLLSNKTVLHRDIKPDNVFLDADGNVKLGDFGLARALEGEMGAQSCVGTPYYMSPEILGGEVYNRKSDVWSLGCLVYEMCALTPPFSGSNLGDLVSNIRLGRQPRIPSIYSDELQSIVSQLLIVRHEFRPTIEVIIHHPTVVSQVVNDRCKSLTRVKETTEVSTKLSREQLDLQQVYLTRLESLKQRESALRDKELVVADRERALDRREKQLSLMDRLAREKMSRADVYLRQCRDSRSFTSGGKSSARRFSVLEPTVPNIDTSFSGDAGDTSLLPTSCKLIPSHVSKPPQFLPERRVHFDTKNRKPFRVIQGHVEAPEEKENETKENSDTFAAERSVWLDRKRIAYKTVNIVHPSATLEQENVQIPIRKYSLRKKPISQNKLLDFTKNGSLGHFR